MQNGSWDNKKLSAFSGNYNLYQFYDLFISQLFSIAPYIFLPYF